MTSKIDSNTAEGNIMADSVPNVGGSENAAPAAFTIRRKKVSSIVPQGQVRENSERNRRKISNGIPRILLITSACNEDVEQSAHDLTREYGFIVRVVCEGDAALQAYSDGIIRGHPNDCIVFDVDEGTYLPHHAPTDIARWIREYETANHERRAAFVFVTGKAHNGIKRIAAELGAEVMLEGANWREELTGILAAVIHK